MRRPSVSDRIQWTICSFGALCCIIGAGVHIQEEPQKAIAYGVMAIVFEGRYWVSKYFDYKIEPGCAMIQEENKR